LHSKELWSSPSAAGLAPHEVVRLSLNENPFGPAPSVVASIAREYRNLCRYTTTEYDTLIDLIAAREEIARDQIILGEILEPLGTYLSQKGGVGGEFVCSNPGYTALIDAAVAVGGRAVGVPLDSELRNDLTALRQKVTSRTRAVYLVNPHNPTGIMSHVDELDSFARDIARYTLLIVDEAYLEFADPSCRHSLAGLVRAQENVIVFRTFAKAFGLAGLEIGYGLLPRPIATALAEQGMTNPHLFNRLAVVAASASLKDTGYLGTVTAKVATERAKWLELFTELKVRHTASVANFVFFKTGQPHADFAERMLERGIDIGRAFPPYDRWARISIGLPAENARACAAVEALLRQS